jgi:hypothetical protein
MDEETIDVPISEESGNVPAEAPSEELNDATPAEKGEPATPAEPEADLFELPDGRKVDGVTLAKEWKENFLPDYTRKSQALAEAKNGNITTNKPSEDNPYADPEYVPQSYEEILKAAEERAIRAIEAKEIAKQEQYQAIENEVLTQLNAVKEIDPNVNENALFLHATKYGFKDLSVAYQNMKDFNQVIKNVQETTAKNIAKRNDPVSITPGGSGQRPDPSQFSNAMEYLRSLK